jgi:hypothetical protein
VEEVRVITTRRVGIAVGSDSLVAVGLDRLGRAQPAAQPWVRHLEPAGEDSGQWPDVFLGLLELRRQLGRRKVRAHIVLAPPLAQVRRLEFPPMKRDLMLAKLAAAPERYFAVHGPQAVGIDARFARQDATQRALGVTASAALVETILRVAGEADFEVASLAPAHVAWATAVAERDAVGGAACVVLGLPQWTGVLRLVAGEPMVVRSVAASLCNGALVGVIEECLPPEGGPRRIKVCADSDVSATIDEALAAADFEVVRLSEEPMALAARYAALTCPEVLPERIRTGRRLRARRLTIGFSLAASFLAATTAGLHLWGLHRELAAVRRERSAIQASVTDALGRREALAQTGAELSALDSLRRTLPRWSQVLEALALSLPRDAHLIRVGGEGDSVTLEGVAERAAGVLIGLQHAQSIVSVRAQAPIRRDLREGQHPLERFILAVRLGHGARPP